MHLPRIVWSFSWSNLTMPGLWGWVTHPVAKTSWGKMNSNNVGASNIPFLYVNCLYQLSAYTFTGFNIHHVPRWLNWFVVLELLLCSFPPTYSPDFTPTMDVFNKNQKLYSVAWAVFEAAPKDVFTAAFDSVTEQDCIGLCWCCELITYLISLLSGHWFINWSSSFLTGLPAFNYTKQSGPV